MGKMRFDKSKSFFERKGFYIALAICLISVGSASYAAINKIDTNNVSSEDTSGLSYSSTFEDVNKVVSDLPYPESSVSESNDINKDSSAEKAAANNDEQVTESSETSSGAPFFVLPSGGTIIKSFNDKELQYSETYKDWRLHLGIDIAGEKGTAVCSSAQGKVTDIYYDSLYGTTVVIDHGNNIVSKYSGLNAKPTVEVGSSVEAGTQIGVIDEIPCESVEQPHLHFEILDNGVNISPLSLIS